MIKFVRQCKNNNNAMLKILNSRNAKKNKNEQF